MKIEYLNNSRTGSAFLTFLPDKKAGNIFKWDLDLQYRYNKFSLFSLIYSGNDYPDQKQEHELRMEFRAEF